MNSREEKGEDVSNQVRGRRGVVGELVLLSASHSVYIHTERPHKSRHGVEVRFTFKTKQGGKLHEYKTKKELNCKDQRKSILFSQTLWQRGTRGLCLL